MLEDKIGLRLADRTVTPDAVATLLAKEPARAAGALRGGARIEAEPAVQAWLQTTAVGPFIGDDGEIQASADFGAFVGGLVLGLCIGFLIGVAVDDLVNTTDQTTDDSTDGSTDDGTTHDNGETGDTGGSQDGGSGGEGGSGS